MHDSNEPIFLRILRQAALKLLAMHDEAPRTVRYVASMQKWLITQAITAIHFERRQDDSLPPLTARTLIDFFAAQPLFSKNTLTAHLAEMRAYGLLIDQETHDRRAKPLGLSGYSERMISQWLESHLEGLDQLDGGNRSTTFKGEPRLLLHMQPIVVRTLVFDPQWSRPPASVDLFVKTESGSNILHDLICRLPEDMPEDGAPLCLGAVRASEISTRHTLSRGHVQRVFARAKSQDLLVWSLPANRGDLSVSQQLVRDYASWQAVKFAAIANAYDKGLRNLRQEQQMNADSLAQLGY
ncbi:hypothetical protein [Rhizobium sp. FY34]|uniref:hypothetical protein n=1 Tax=Rhizobium sp. FY34 TaxID=2562309 RepID=UPI0010BFBE7E|nr:hypothetical protein [Rhizobium sp. FY34]